MHNLGNVWGDIQICSDIGGITGRAYFEFLIIPALNPVRKNARNLLLFFYGLNYTQVWIWQQELLVLVSSNKLGPHYEGHCAVCLRN